MPTERLYYQNAQIREFSASVLEEVPLPEGKWGIVLDRTAFYPEGGGQPCDLGFINQRPVLEVKEVKEEKIIHILSGRPESSKVKGEIDWLRRFDHMQQHSGEHILSAAFERIMGAHNVGFHLGPFSTQIDLDVQGLEEKHLQEVELLANEMVWADIQVQTHFLSREALDSIKVRKLPSKELTELRLVDIPGLDCCPCGGTHVLSTGQVGLIKIRFWERNRSGTRVDFVCGCRALWDYRQKNQITATLSARLSSPLEQLLEVFQSQTEKTDALLEELTKAQEKVVHYQAQKLYQKAEIVKGVKIISYSAEETKPEKLLELAKRLTAFGQTITILGDNSREKGRAFLVLARSTKLSLDMRLPLQSALPLLQGKGGGTAQLVQGGGSEMAALSQAMETVKISIVNLI